MAVLYSEFVSRALSCVEPMMPEGSKVIREFCGVRPVETTRPFGNPSRVIKAEAGSATLWGARAALFAALARASQGMTGMNLAAYHVVQDGQGKTGVGISCYERNLRRWLGGQLPRWTRTRLELCIISTCWAYGWEPNPANKNGSTLEAESACRSALLGLAKDILGEHVSDAESDDVGPLRLLAILWMASSTAYRSSLQTRHAEGAAGRTRHDSLALGRRIGRTGD